MYTGDYAFWSFDDTRFGIIVPRQRVVDSMHRVDPLSQIIRRRVTTYRRQYSVPAPNSLW